MILNIHYMITLGLLFAMFATGAYKKSFSTMMFLIALAAAMFFIKACERPITQEIALFFVNFVSFVAVIRAILHKDKDKILRR